MHPVIPELKDQYQKGKISRREFIRYAVLLGLPLAGAQALISGCTPAAAPKAPAAPTAANAPVSAGPTAAPQVAKPVRGGTIRCASAVDLVDHPSRINRTNVSNALRNVLEFLTLTDEKNLTRPYLLEKWQASEDLKTWTLNLRQGIKWSNGDDLTTDDVMFSMKQWLNKDVGSSMRGLMPYLTPENIEQVDKSTVKLHLSSPQVAVPEHLFHYAAFILNAKTFQGDITKNPVGTGPMTLEEYTVNQRVVLKARKNYWQKGADGQPLPYLDGITYINLGDDQSAALTAFKSGQVDTIYNVQPATWQALKGDPNVVMDAVPSARTAVLRMHAEKAPWSDVRVRNALKLCQNREKIAELAYYGEALIGQDVHVSPVQPDYAPIDTPKMDVQKAKSLLAEAGFPNGLDCTLTIMTGWDFLRAYAEALKEDAAPAGFRINIEILPAATYNAQWTDLPLGITSWAHRATAIMTLPLAYGVDADGKAASWNETHWIDKEFIQLLTQASGTLDLEKRKQVVYQLEKIQQERGTIGNCFWMKMWTFTRKGFFNLKAQPSQYDLWNEVWYDPKAA